MSSDDVPASDKAVAPYTVGYGKPPAERRFKPGASGNPRGRPRKAQPSGPPPALCDSLAVDMVLLSEAYRTVTLREGDKPVTLTTVSAVFRSLALSGLKGNRLAAKTFVEHVEKAESRRLAQAIASVERAVAYKENWTDAIEFAQARGIRGPKIFPHPDDVVIGSDGAPEILGPSTAAEQADWEKMQARARVIDEVVQEALVAWRAKGKRAVEIKPFYFDEMVYEHRNRLMLRFSVPDEATRRAHRYRRPNRDDIMNFAAATKVEYRLYNDLTEAERNRFVWAMERYERELSVKQQGSII